MLLCRFVLRCAAAAAAADALSHHQHEVLFAATKRAQVLVGVSSQQLLNTQSRRCWLQQLNENCSKMSWLLNNSDGMRCQTGSGDLSSWNKSMTHNIMSGKRENLQRYCFPERWCHSHELPARLEGPVLETEWVTAERRTKRKKSNRFTETDFTLPSPNDSWAQWPQILFLILIICQTQSLSLNTQLKKL